MDKRKAPISTAELVRITRQRIEQTSDPATRAAFEEALRSNIALETEAAETLAKLRESESRVEKLVQDTRTLARILPWVLALAILGTFLAKYYF